MAAEAHKPAIVLAGRATVSRPPHSRDTGAGEGLGVRVDIHPLAEVDPDPAKQMENAAPLLEELAYRAGTGIARR
jgi:hypothetical protein